MRAKFGVLEQNRTKVYT